ncbi:MAG: hypothetical protein ABSD71_00230 [Bacteroidales bacterium]|jgi:hypothetical protein
MPIEPKYPKDNEIKVKWTPIHMIILILGTLIIIGFLINELKINFLLTSKIISAIGLYFNILGIVISSLRTPFYGSFYDGGELEFKKHNAEKKYVNTGMLLIILGVILSIIGIV